MNMLLNRCRRRAHLAEELVEEAWFRDHRDAMQVYAAEEINKECVEVSKLLRASWNIVLDRLFNEDIEDIDGCYRVMSAVVGLIINTVKRAYSMARRLVDKGYTVERFSELGAMIPTLEELRLEIDREWPTVDPQMVAESQAAYSRGEYQSSEDLLSNAQGGSSETNQ